MRIPFSKYRIIAVANALLGLLAIVLFLLLIRQTISMYTGSLQKPTIKNSPLQQQAAKKKEFKDYGIILKKNPFGFYGGELSQLGSGQGEASAITDVTLVGTVAGHKEFSFAIFADKSNVQEVFRIGDNVFGIGRLESVEKEKVIINSGGSPKSIHIADIITIKEAAMPSKTSLPSESLSGDRFAKRVGETAFVVDSQRLQHAIANPQQIMTDARLLPNYQGERQEGFVLREVRQGGIYQSLGLQNGDILLNINEYNISNPESALQAFTALKGMDRVQLGLIRNGARMTMTYQIK